MAEQIKIYHGDTVQTIQPEPGRSYTFGEGKKCDYVFPKGSCAGAQLKLTLTDAGWQVSCKGKVERSGRPVQDGAAAAGDMFVLNAAERMAVQLSRREHTAAARVPLEDVTELLIGRGANCALQLQNRRVSSGHAKLYYIGGEWRVCDINSTNGTFVNGKKIADSPLREGDAISVGPYQLVFGGGMLEVYGSEGAVVLNLPETETAAPGAYPYFNRSPRLTRQYAGGKLEIEAAPGIGSKPEINWLMALLPTIGTTAISLAVTAFSGMSSTSMLFSVPMMVMGIVTTVLNYRSQCKKYARTENLRLEKYQKYIADCETQIQEAVRQQRDAALHSNPTPAQCVKLARKVDRRLWERTCGDEDFMTLRIGQGSEPLALEVVTPKLGFMLEEDTFTRTPQQLADKYRTVGEMPVVCDLLRKPSLGIIGSRVHAVRAAHTLAAQLAVHHGYDEVKLVVLYPQQEQDQWAWMRWLPHTFDETRSTRYLAATKYDAGRILAPLAEELKRRAAAAGQDSWNKTSPQMPYYLFLVADPSLLAEQPVADYLLRNDPTLGVGCVLLASALNELPRGVVQILDARARDSELYDRDQAGSKRIFQPDPFTAADGETLARALAPVRLPEKDSAQLLPSSITFLQGYHVQRPDQLDLGDYWANSCNYQSMAVPVGVRANGENFNFDIHEKRHGPHGLVAGMTGSGKSEMVQSWILSMALQFSPQDASFVLIDFKGTGLILPFLNLPHLAGTISDLDSNINRNLIALESELQRRKALFDSAGVNNITAYLKLYRAGRVSEPLSYLFVIIDEYAEFKAKFPEFTDEINTLFRTGRSMGVHIMLLTQNPAGVISAESENNVRFRWCLKVASAAASKEVLGGHDEAARITNPGRAYVRVGSDEVFEPVQSFYSGAPYQPDRAEKAEAEPTVAQVTLTGERVRVKQAGEKKKQSGRGTEIDAVVSYIRDYTTRHNIPDARHIWQSRMPGQIFLPDLLAMAKPHAAGELAPAVALLDDPCTQTQRPLYLPLSSDGHVAVYGAPGTGKTVFLQTLAASLCSQYSPDEVNLYMMDFGGWSMGMFKNYPHVGIIANDNEEDKIEAIARKLEAELQDRKARFAKEGVGNLRTYLRATGETLPYLVLMVDNFAPVYQLYPQLEDFFIKLGREGGNYGIILVATCSSTMALGYKLNQSVKTNIALQMTDYSEYSTVVGRTEGMEPEHLPGRGLFREGRVLEFQTALPAPVGADGTYIMAIRALGDQLTARWGKGLAGAISVMPDRVTFGCVPAQNGGCVLGLATEDLKPVEATLPAPHSLLISGIAGSGKTTLLKTIARQLVQSGCGVVIYGNAEEYACVADQVSFLPDGAAADSFLTALSEELGQRQAAQKADPNVELKHVCLLVDGYKHFFEEISQQSAARLRALLVAGAGLGVSFVAADNANALAGLAQFMEPVTMQLAKGPAVLLEGKAMEHLAVETDLDPLEKSRVLKPHEGWFKTADGIRRFKAMDCE